MNNNLFEFKNVLIVVKSILLLKTSRKNEILSLKIKPSLINAFLRVIFVIKSKKSHL